MFPTFSGLFQASVKAVCYCGFQTTVSQVSATIFTFFFTIDQKGSNTLCNFLAYMISSLVKK